MDKIILKNLAVTCIIGTEEQERHTPQTVWFDVTLELDLSRAAASDNLFDSVNYAELAEKIRRTAGQSAFLLIERLAGSALDCCMSFPEVRTAVVRVTKKPASMAGLDGVCVELARSRN